MTKNTQNFEPVMGMITTEGGRVIDTTSSDVQDIIGKRGIIRGTIYNTDHSTSAPVDFQFKERLEFPQPHLKVIIAGYPWKDYLLKYNPDSERYEITDSKNRFRGIFIPRGQ